MFGTAPCAQLRPLVKHLNQDVRCHCTKITSTGSEFIPIFCNFLDVNYLDIKVNAINLILYLDFNINTIALRLGAFTMEGRTIYLLSALIGGAILPVQVALNTLLRRYVGEPMQVTFVSYLAGLWHRL